LLLSPLKVTAEFNILSEVTGTKVATTISFINFCWREFGSISFCRNNKVFVSRKNHDRWQTWPSKSSTFSLLKGVLIPTIFSLRCCVEIFLKIREKSLGKLNQNNNKLRWHHSFIKNLPIKTRAKDLLFKVGFKDKILLLHHSLQFYLKSNIKLLAMHKHISMGQNSQNFFQKFVRFFRNFGPFNHEIS